VTERVKGGDQAVLSASRAIRYFVVCDTIHVGLSCIRRVSDKVLMKVRERGRTKLSLGNGWA